MSKSKDNAIAIMSGDTSTPEAMVPTGDSIMQAIKGSPEYANAPEVQAALDLWAAENANLDANNQKKVKARQELAQAEADEVSIVRRWGTRRQGVLHAVNVHCDGSKEKVQSFNLGVIERKKAPQATVPTKLRATRGKKPTTASIAWSPTPGADGYMVQRAADPANPATYAPPAMCKRSRYGVDGLTIGSTIAFRVLALDPSLPNGQTDYSPWLIVTVGA